MEKIDNITSEYAIELPNLRLRFLRTPEHHGIVIKAEMSYQYDTDGPTTIVIRNTQVAEAIEHMCNRLIMLEELIE